MIQIKNLTKSFDGFKSLDGLFMNVKKGSIYALVGTNGAGKTTTLNHIAGIYKSDEGECTINNENSYDNKEVKKIIGYIPDELFFFNNYSIKNMKSFYKNMYKTWNEERYKELVLKLEINEKKRIKTFSKGQKKQVAFALIMSFMPQILILDEPIDGLDPIVKKIIIDYIIEDVAARETTVIISSHNLKEMDTIADHIGIIKKGKMLIEGDLDEIRAGSNNNENLSLDEIFIEIYNKDEKNKEEAQNV